MRAVGCFICVSTLFVFDVVAANDTGKELLRQCQGVVRSIDAGLMQAEVSDFSQGRCFGLTEGVRSTMMMLRSQLKDIFPMCWPDSINNEVAIRAVVKYLEDNPDTLQMDQSVAVMTAYIGTYGCDQRGK